MMKIISILKSKLDLTRDVDCLRNLLFSFRLFDKRLRIDLFILRQWGIEFSQEEEEEEGWSDHRVSAALRSGHYLSHSNNHNLVIRHLASSHWSGEVRWPGCWTLIGWEVAGDISIVNLYLNLVTADPSLSLSRLLCAGEPRDGVSNTDTRRQAQSSQIKRKYLEQNL